MYKSIFLLELLLYNAFYSFIAEFSDSIGMKAKSSQEYANV